MPDPVVKTWLTTEAGRTVAFDFVKQPEVQAGEQLASIMAGPFCNQAGITFGPVLISGTKVLAKVNGTLTDATDYHMWVTILTTGGNPLTCAGTIHVQAP